MIERLVLDFVRRQRASYGAWWIGIAVIWTAVCRGLVNPESALAATMAGAFIVGPLLAFQLTPREVLMLPVSRPEIWRARWILTVIVPAAVAMTARFAALGIDQAWRAGEAPDYAGVAIATLCDAAYAGGFLVLLPLSQAASRAERTIAGAWTSGALIILVWTIVVGGLGWPYLLRAYLPARPDLVMGPAGAILAAMIVLVGGCYFLTPTAVLQSGRKDHLRAWARQRPRRRMPRIGDQLTAIQRLLWTDGVATVRTILLVLFGQAIVLGVILAPQNPQDTLAGYLREFGGLPFDNGTPFPHIFTSLIVLGSLSLGGARSLTSRHDFLLSMVRHLRVLPLSTRQLNALLIGVPVLGWATLWILLLIIHIVVTRRPPDTLQPEAFVFLAGVDTFARALQMRWRRDVLSWCFMLLIAMFVPFAMVRTGTSAESMHVFRIGFVAVGLAHMAAAVWVNRATLTRSRSAYAPFRPSLSPFWRT